MNITGNLLHHLSQRAFVLHGDYEAATRALSALRSIAVCPQAQEDAECALRRVIARAEAWMGFWERAYERATPAEADRSDRLDDMKRRPFAYSAAQLVAERHALDVSLNWCMDRSARAGVAA